MKENKKTLIIVLILLIAIPLIIYLVRQQQILRSRAGTFGTAPIQFTGDNVYSLPNGRVGFTTVNGQPTVNLLLTSNLGSSNSPSATIQPSPTASAGTASPTSILPSPTPGGGQSLTPTTVAGGIKNPDFDCVTNISDSVVNSCLTEAPLGHGGYVGSVPGCDQSGTFRICTSNTEACGSTTIGVRNSNQHCRNQGVCLLGSGYNSWRVIETSVVMPCSQE